MAATRAGRALTEEHRLRQQLIARELIAQLRLAWPLLDLRDLDASAPGWMSVAYGLVEAQFIRSARASGEYLAEFLRAERGRTADPPVGIDEPLTLDPRTMPSLQFAGPVKVKQGIMAGRSGEQAMSFAFAQVARESQRHALNGGRERILRSIRSDRRARGFQRVTDGDPCAFCAMLASRGPVYSGRDFQSHHGCGCTLEPVYRADSQSVGRAEEWAALWRETGTLSSFRAAYEGR